LIFSLRIPKQILIEYPAKDVPRLLDFLAIQQIPNCSKKNHFPKKNQNLSKKDGFRFYRSHLKIMAESSAK